MNMVLVFIIGFAVGSTLHLMNQLSSVEKYIPDTPSVRTPLIRLDTASAASNIDTSTRSSSSNIVSPIIGPKSTKFANWPAIAYEEVGHSLVTKGDDSMFHHARDLYFSQEGYVTNNPATTMTPLMEEFLQVYKNRPDPVNLCGIRINHALALFLAVKQIQPTLVVESGVNAGVSTYFIRAASPTTRIFAIDTLAEPICGQGTRWLDTTKSKDKTINYTGENFVDLMDLDWSGMISRKEIDPAKTLVFLDDHLHAYKRIVGVMKFGVRHIVVEDNYKLSEGATYNDRKSTPKQMFLGAQYKTEGDWLFHNMVAYAEFPPLVPPIVSIQSKTPRKRAGGFMVASDTNRDITAPMLRPDLNESELQIYHSIAKTLGVDPSLVDEESYMQFMNYNQICHLELLAMPPWNME